jgi:hypothetical protein
LLLAAIVAACLQSPPASAAFDDPLPGFWLESLRYTAEGPAEDAALGDADGDGDLDLFVVDGRLELWRNDGRGAFPDSADALAPGSFTSIACADLDGDAHLDVVGALAAGAGTLAFLRGLGGGDFAPPVLWSNGARYREIVLADLDADGTPEILGVRSPESAAGFEILRYTGEGGFQVDGHLLDGSNVATVAVADLNDDARPDVVAGVLAGQRPARLEVLVGDGGRFTTAATAIPGAPSFRPHQIVPVDLDGDGDLDLVTGEDDGLTNVFINDGTARAWTIADREFAPRVGWATVHAADTDLDGRSELFVSWRARGREGILISEYQCGDDPSLARPTLYSYTHSWDLAEDSVSLPPTGAVSGDLDLDGRPDLVLIGRTTSDRPAAAPRGVIGVILTRPDGRLGAIRFLPVAGGAGRIHAVRLRPAGPVDILLGGPGVARVDLSSGAARRIADGRLVGATDLNRDGRDDLLIASGDSVHVRLTGGTASPEDSTRGSPAS